MHCEVSDHTQLEIRNPLSQNKDRKAETIDSNYNVILKILLLGSKKTSPICTHLEIRVLNPTYEGS